MIKASNKEMCFLVLLSWVFVKKKILNGLLVKGGIFFLKLVKLCFLLFFIVTVRFE